MIGTPPAPVCWVAPLLAEVDASLPRRRHLFLGAALRCVVKQKKTDRQTPLPGRHSCQCTTKPTLFTLAKHLPELVKITDLELPPESLPLNVFVVVPQRARLTVPVNTPAVCRHPRSA